MELHGSSQKHSREGARHLLHTATIATGALIAWSGLAAQARAGGHLFDHHCGNCRDVVLLVPVETTVASPAQRTIIVRTVAEYEPEPASEADDTDDGSREIVVRKLAPSLDERPAKSGSRDLEKPLPPLLKTTVDADGRRIPQVSGDDSATGTRSIGDSSDKTKVVVVRESSPSASRVVVRKYVRAESVRSIPVQTRTVRVASPTVCYRVAAPTVIVRESTTVSAIPAVIVKRGWCKGF